MTKMMRCVGLSLLALTTGCGGGEGSSSAPASGTDPIAVAPTPSPSPSDGASAAPVAPATPTPTPPDPTFQEPAAAKNGSGYVELPAIASNFDTSEMLLKLKSLPASSAPDPVGAFRFLCRPTHNAYDDPIVFPGQPGKAHLHTFFGNTGTNGNSTYESLRTTGDSSCSNMLNRSAYWIPALMNGRGQVVMPDHLSVYYKRHPASDPVCQQGKGCISIPRGLRYVFGRTASGPEADDRVYFDCNGPGAKSGHYRSLAEAARFCPTGARIGANLPAPSCWNGTQLDSPDHRSHMSYKVRNRQTGKEMCPSSHPYVLPTFRLGAWYNVDDTLDKSGDLSPNRDTWYFSSDRMPGMTPQTSGMTFHADWFGAWDDNVLRTWVDNCIDKHLNCSDGVLGDGTMMRKNALSKTKVPSLVAVPPRPTI